MISIIISVYNGEKFLQSTLTSIAAQTFKDWELIAVNDASADHTLYQLKAFQKNHPENVTVIENQTNLGLTKSLIKAAHAAKGDYLARIDAGDQFSGDKLGKQIAFLEKNPEFGLIGCNYTNISLPSHTAKKSHVPLTNETIKKTILKKNPFAHSCIVIRKNIYDKVGGYNSKIKYGQDYELWFRVLQHTKAANLSEYLCTRFIDENSISYQKQHAQMWQCLKTQWTYMNRLNPLHYLYLLEPVVLLLLPNRLKMILRRL